MGLQSAMTVSLTGLQAAETVIDVVGNNVANSGTVGFKESDVLFATQFLQTQSIGSAPTESTGGTNPRQIGLGVKVAAINPDFTQGTIQISSNPLDVAIQGDGFLVAEGAQGEQLYTRNGQLQTNSQNEVVNANGNRILGLPVDDNFEIDETRGLAPIQIPLGSQVVAQATQNAYFAGNLNPSFEIGTSGVLTSQELGDGTIEHPIDAAGAPGNTFDGGEFQVTSAPNVSGSTSSQATIGSGLPAGDYAYRVVWYKTSGPNTYESASSSAISATGVPLNGEVTLNNLPVDATTTWDGRRIYRSLNGGTFQLLDSVATTGATYVDDNSVAISASPLDLGTMDQNEYSYYVTFVNSTEGIESRPSNLIGPFAITDAVSRIRIDNLPQPTQTGFDKVRIYRNVNNSTSEFHRISELDTGITTYIDGADDDAIDGNPLIDLVGAKASAATRLTDVVLRTGDTYTQPFVLGTLSFAGEKGGRDLAAKDLVIDANSTVNDLKNFMVQAYGMDTTLGAGGTLNASGQLVFTSNTGIENEVGTGLASFTMDPDGLAGASPISFSFDNTTDAVGEGTTTSFVVFDSLGEPLNVRLTTVKVEETATTFTYRWFATSADNEPIGSVNTFLGSGELDFDRNGNIDSSDARPEIALLHPQELPLIFNLDFSAVSGLSETNAAGNPTSDLSLTLQDGFPPGSLTSFTITESGLIRGVFSNGAERPLGQLQMARFANTAGLQQVGTNLYAKGVNSGEPIIGDPGAQGLGTLTSGAVELSNSDIGQNLIDLILASTQYRGGARVITTAQQLLDELLNLRR